jgi:hypothetical protein
MLRLNKTIWPKSGLGARHEPSTTTMIPRNTESVGNKVDQESNIVQLPLTPHNMKRAEELQRKLQKLRRELAKILEQMFER